MWGAEELFKTTDEQLSKNGAENLCRYEAQARGINPDEIEVRQEPWGGC